MKAEATRNPESAILDSLLEGCQVVDFNWRYFYLNDAVVAQSHKTRAELIGKTMMESYPGIENTPLFAVLERVMRNRKAERFENEFTYPDGQIGWFDLHIEPCAEGILILSQEATGAKLAMRRLEIQLARLAALRQIDLAITSGKRLATIAELILTQVTAILGVVGAAIMLFDSQDDPTQVFMHGLKNISVSDIVIKRSQGLVGNVLADAKTVVVNKLATETAFIRNALVDKEGIAGYAGTPLIVKERVIGILECYHTEAIPNNQEWLSYFETLAGQVAIAVESALAQEKLSQSEERFRKVFQLSPVGVLLTNVRDGRFLDANMAACEILGFPREELIGQKSTDLNILSPEAREKVTREIREKGLVRGIELPINNPQLGRRDVLYSVEQVEVGGDQCFLTVMIDNTDRKHAEAAAKLSQVRFKGLVDSAMDAVISINEKQEIVLFNSAAETMFGYNATNMVGKSIDFLIPERFRSVHPKHIEKFSKSGTTSRRMGNLGEIYGVRSNGEEFAVEASISQFETGGNKFFSVILRDTTDRKRAEELLRKSEEQYRRIAETSEEGIWLIDAEDRTTFVNPKLSSMFGYSPDEMMGRVLYEFIDRESASTARASLEKRRQGINEQVDFKFQRKNGSDLWAIVAASPVFQDGKYVGALAMITDITERRKTEEDLRHSEERNRSLYESAQQRLSQTMALRNIDNAISNSLDLRFTLDIVLTQTRNELKVDAADILLYNETTHMLDFFVGQGFRTTATQEAHIPLGKSYAGNVVLERKPMHLSNLSSTKTEFLESAHFPLEGFEEYHCMPLIAKGKVLGVLEIFNRTALNPHDEWLDYLGTLAGQAAIAIDNITLFEGLQKANDKLVLGYDATIEGWSRALDLRDKETEGHTQRVTNLTMQLAARMGIKDEELVQVRRGALLHDIGKMGVPDNILHKPDKLSEEEWRIMKQHPVFAYQLLSPVAYLQGALDIPYAHHEKWDGSGYPRGLKGEAIPFTARLFAVIDVYDALTSDRPYRKAWPKEKALDYIKEQSGTHFDPRVVKTFLEMGIAKS